MKRALAAVLVLLFLMPPAALAGGSNAYQQTNLVSDMAGVAAHTDAQLVNPWGIAFFPGAPFWVADNNAGVSTLYDANGNKQALVVAIPTASGGAGGTPTGIVTNSTGKFGGYVFIFDTEDGAIVGWKSGTAGAVATTKAAAVYKGLAMITNAGAPFLLATNFNSGSVDVYNGNFLSRFASAGTLNAPWGVVRAPASGFGLLSGALLVGNFGGGGINAYNAMTGKSLGMMKNEKGKALNNIGLWDMVFGAGGTGSPTTLYLAAGIFYESHGLFASLTVVPVSLLPVAMKFSAPVNTTSAAKVATLANNTSSSISISSVAVSDTHFVITSNTCGASLAPGATCKISVAFAPTAVGSVTGTLSVTDSGAGSPQKVALTGTGT